MATIAVPALIATARPTRVDRPDDRLARVVATLQPLAISGHQEEAVVDPGAVDEDRRVHVEPLEQADPAEPGHDRQQVERDLHRGEDRRHLDDRQQGGPVHEQQQEQDPPDRPALDRPGALVLLLVDVGADDRAAGQGKVQPLGDLALVPGGSRGGHARRRRRLVGAVHVVGRELDLDDRRPAVLADDAPAVRRLGERTDGTTPIAGRPVAGIRPGDGLTSSSIRPSDGSRLGIVGLGGCPGLGAAEAGTNRFG